jgi:hypothetical protein
LNTISLFLMDNDDLTTAYKLGKFNSFVQSSFKFKSLGYLKESRLLAYSSSMSSSISWKSLSIISWEIWILYLDLTWTPGERNSTLEEHYIIV